MNKILAITINDLRVFFSDRGNLIGVLLTPIILSLVLGYAFSSGSDAPAAIPMDVIDLDNSEQSALLLAELQEVNATLRFCPAAEADDDDDVCNLDDDQITLTQEEGLERIRDEETTALLVIPEGFGTKLGALEPASVDYYSLADMTTGDAVRRSLDALVQRMNGAVIAVQVGTSLVDALDVTLDESDSFSDAVYQRANDLWVAEPAGVRYVLAHEGEQDEDEIGGGFTQSVPGMATMFVLFNVLTGMALLIREQKRWTLQRMIVMPVTRTQLIAGKVLSRFLVGLTTFVILIIVGLFVGVDYGNNPVAVVLIMVFYTLSVTALTFALAPLVHTENQANSLANLLGLMMAALGGAWWPLEIVPEFMQVIGHFSPIAWAMDAFHELIWYGGSLVDILPYLGVLLVFSAVFFVIGVMAFSYE